MQTSQDDTKIINTRVMSTRSEAIWATYDAQARSNDALAAHPDFFRNPDHLAKIEKVKGIIADFFGTDNTVYINHRYGRGSQHFTAVKVTDLKWPRATKDYADSVYYQPLRAMGITPVFSKQSNSWLYRIY